MRSVACVVLLIAVFSSTAARSDTNDGPLIEKGLQLRRQHRDAEALEFFRRAHEANRTPRARAQIALAEQALGQWVDAERDLLAALAVRDDPWISSHREALEGALEAIGKRLATLTVTADVAMGEVWLNGVPVGELPMTPARIPAGSVRIEVRSKGYQPALRGIELAPGAIATEEFRLTAVVETAPIVEATLVNRAPLGARTVADQSLSVVQPSASVSHADATRRALAWGALGAAGAFLGGAVVAQIVREDRASKYNDDSRCLYGELSRDERCGVYRGQAESAQTLASIGFIAAGALGIGSAILFVASPGKPRTTGASVWLDVGATGIRLDIGGKL